MTLAIPQDVQAEAFDFPAELFAKRVWHVRRPVPEPEAFARGGRADPIREAAADRGRRRGPLLGRDGGAARVRGGHRGSRSARRMAGKGALAYDDPLGPGCDRRHRNAGREPSWPRGRPRDRRRHPLLGLHDRLQDRVPGSGRALRERQRLRVRRLQARGAARDRGRASRWRPSGPPSRAGRWSLRVSGAGGPVQPRVGRRGPAATTTAATRHCPARARSSAPSTPSRGRRTSWCARRAACPATCTSSGARATPRATTSSTATPAWATRVAGGVGVKMAAPDRDVYVMVGDGSSAHDVVRPRHRVAGGGSRSPSSSSTTAGSGRSATSRRRWGPTPSAPRYRYRGPDGQLSGDRIRVDFTANARSLGVSRHRLPDHRGSPRRSRGSARADAGHRAHHRDRPAAGVPGYESWWTVPPAEVSEMDKVKAVRRAYEDAVKKERWFL